MQIVKGVDAGEVVITEGADRLKDGARVTIPDETARTRGAEKGDRQTGGAVKGERGARERPAGAPPK